MGVRNKKLYTGSLGKVEIGHGKPLVLSSFLITFRGNETVRKWLHSSGLPRRRRDRNFNDKDDLTSIKLVSQKKVQVHPFVQYILFNFKISLTSTDAKDIAFVK